jgi:transcriptional regulator with XRE-family HTH domain
MTIGEKIKCFRTINKMTQKSLGEVTGIGEATIRKYELGIRNPKPAQLKKIAQALDIGENLLLDIPFSSLDIATVGNAMALLLLLENRLGATYTIPTNSKGEIDISKISIHFENAKVNEHLARWISECQIEKSGKKFAKEHSDSFPMEEQEKLAIHAKVILEETKQSITSDDTLLQEGTVKK